MTLEDLHSWLHLQDRGQLPEQIEAAKLGWIVANLSGRMGVKEVQEASIAGFMTAVQKEFKADG